MTQMHKSKSVWDSHLSPMTAPKTQTNYIIPDSSGINICQTSFKWGQLVWWSKRRKITILLGLKYLTLISEGCCSPSLAAEIGQNIPDKMQRRQKQNKVSAAMFVWSHSLWASAGCFSVQLFLFCCRRWLNFPTAPNSRCSPCPSFGSVP